MMKYWPSLLLIGYMIFSLFSRYSTYDKSAVLAAGVGIGANIFFIIGILVGKSLRKKND